MSAKFVPTPDNPYLFLLNIEWSTPIEFNAFLSVAPGNICSATESPFP
jgi:hypothetical protein